LRHWQALLIIRQFGNFRDKRRHTGLRHKSECKFPGVFL